jgi:hypothetical protein
MMAKDPAEPSGHSPFLATAPVSTGQSPRRDPWAHRRVEPRGLAILWSTYLFFLTITIFAGGPLILSGSVESSRAKARLMLAAVAIGVAVLWPLLRLSQTRPIRGEPGGGTRDAGTIADWLVLMAPAQAVIWPQGTKLLAGWPLSVVGAVSAWIAAWGLLVGAFIAIALRPSTRTSLARADDASISDEGLRAAWMALLLALGGIGGLAVLVEPAMIEGSLALFRPAWMFSPVTGIYELTLDRSWNGSPAVVTASHWWAIAVVALVSIPVWAWAWISAGKAPSMRSPCRQDSV